MLVRIYRDRNEKENYEKMCHALEMLYRTRPNVRMTRSRLIEKLVCNSNSMRKGKLRIKNVRLGKTIYWDHNKPLSKEMIDDGWEYGLYLNESQIKRKSNNSSRRKWMCKDGFKDVFVKEYETGKYLNDGYRFGRMNLPEGFRDWVSEMGKRTNSNNKRNLGKISIYNTITLETKNIDKNDEIPRGWKRGRGHSIILRMKERKKFTELYNEYKSLFYDYGKLKLEHSDLKMPHKQFLHTCKSFTSVYEPRSVRHRIVVLKYFELFNDFGYQAVVDFGYKGVRHSLLALFRHNGLR